MSINPRVNETTSEAPARRAPPAETTRILAECRDRAVQRLMLSFGRMLESVCAMLIERAGNTVVREEQMVYLDARGALLSQRASIMAAFEEKLRRRVDDRILGKEQPKADFSTLDAASLALVEPTKMDESVITSNIVRVVENLCYEELQTFNRGMGHLLGNPDLEVESNPLAPTTIVEAFAEALHTVQGEDRIKYAILKELNRSSLGEINSIYADLNQHLLALRVVPVATVRGVARGGAGKRPAASVPGAAGAAQAPAAAPAGSELDIMSLFRRMFGSPSAARASAPAPRPASGAGASGVSTGGATMGGAAVGDAGAAAGAGAPGAAFVGFDPVAYPHLKLGALPATPSGYVPGAPIMVTPELGEGLYRLQHGETGFDAGGGAIVQFAGIPEGQHNVLRDLQASPLGEKASQLESMTIELVAMLFDYIFDTKDLPDGIKALLARLQIPVLKAAMLDGAFFAKKSHPARLLVNELAQAGLGWSPEMGQHDPLYRKLEEIVHKILDGFTDDLALFESMREALQAYLAEEQNAAEINIQLSAEEVNDRDRRHVAQSVARAETENRIASNVLPNFLADFLREKWSRVLEAAYYAEGSEGAPWKEALATVDDFAWSVQPKRTAEERKRLVTSLPAMLKRLNAGLRDVPWPPDDRERFMANLVEAHAAAVKPALATVASPTTAIAEQARAEAAYAKAAGDEAAAARAEQLAAAMAPAEPAKLEVHEVVADHFLEIAQSLERGTWVEFEDEDGQLSFAKLAWLSPLRGTYLFTNRQGQKAISMTAEDLAERFRNDSARLVEAEPLIDRAFSSVMQNIGQKYPEPVSA